MSNHLIEASVYAEAVVREIGRTLPFPADVNHRRVAETIQEMRTEIKRLRAELQTYKDAPTIDLSEESLDSDEVYYGAELAKSEARQRPPHDPYSA